MTETDSPEQIALKITRKLKRREYLRIYSKKRYDNDLAYREQKKATMRKYHKKDLKAHTMRVKKSQLKKKMALEALKAATATTL